MELLVSNQTFGSQKYPRESEFDEICNWYTEHLHGPLTAFICIMGAFSNLINAFILTRKSLISPVSILLTALATAECIKMGCYLIYSIHFYSTPFFWFWRHNENSHHNYSCIMLLLILQNVGICTHFFSMSIAVYLASFRYIIIKTGKYSHLSKLFCTYRGTKCACIAIFIISMLSTIPNSLMHDILPIENNQTIAGYWFTESKYANGPLKTLNFALFGICGKLFGSFFLGILSWLIVKNLNKAQIVAQRIRKQRRALRQRRVSLMIAVVALSFAIAEAPQGILLIISGMNDAFYENYYVKLGDILDLLTLANGCVNFLLYCAMSTKFRRKFLRIFCDPLLNCKKNESEFQSPIYISLMANIPSNINTLSNERSQSQTRF